MFKEEDLKLNDGHSLEQTSFENKIKGSEDMDITCYDEKDNDGNIVSKYKIYEITNKYPPFSQYTNYEKFDLEGTLVDEGRF